MHYAKVMETNLRVYSSQLFWNEPWASQRTQTAMSVVLWPRQEVLQLVIPHLGNVGKGLNQFNAFHAVNKLSKLQNQDHMIR